MDYNRSYSFRYKDSSNVSQMEVFDCDKLNQLIASDLKSVGQEQVDIQENPLSQYKILQQFSTQLLLENVNTGNRVIYKEFFIPSHKNFKELQNELMLRKQIEQENVLRLNFYLMQKQQFTSEQKFGMVFDNFIRDFDSELETRKQNKIKLQELIQTQGININSKEQLYQIITNLSKINNIPLFWSEEELLNTIESVLNGIQQLHKLNIVHGNLNTQSIVFSDDGYVKIADQFVVNHNIYKKETIDLLNQSFIPPENTVYTIECDLWAIGLIFLEAAILENSLEIYREISPKYKRNPKHLLNNQASYFQQQKQIDFSLIKKRIEDIRYISSNSQSSSIFLSIIQTLLSEDPKNRSQAYQYIQSLNNVPENLHKEQLINSQINSNNNTNTNTNSNVGMSQNSNMAINSYLNNINTSQNIKNLTKFEQNPQNIINQKNMSLSDIETLSLKHDILEAHQNKKQNLNQKDGFRKNILDLNEKNVQKQVLSEQNVSQSNLSFCTQMSDTSQKSNNSLKKNIQGQQQLKQNINLKVNNLMNKQTVNLNLSSKFQRLDDICNTEGDIPSLDLSLIAKESPNQIQQSKSQQISKSFMLQNKENLYQIKQNQIQSIQKGDIHIKLPSPKNQNFENIQKKTNKNQKTLDQINFTQKSRQSTIIDFHLSNPSNKFGLESPSSLSFDSYSCKSQQFQQLFQNQQKQHKQLNQKENNFEIKEKENNFEIKDNKYKVNENIQLIKQDIQFNKEDQNPLKVQQADKQLIQKINHRQSQSLNQSSDQISSQRSFNQNTQRKRSTSIQPLENESCFKNDDIKISMRKCFDQQIYKNQINNQNSQNSQNKLNDFNLNEIQILNQEQSQQQQIPQKNDNFFNNYNLRKQQSQKQSNLNKEMNQLSTCMTIQQKEQQDDEKNERTKSSMSLRKQYSNLSNLVDSCLQRSRSVISNSLQQRNSGKSVIERQQNNLSQSFQNQNNNSYNFINNSQIFNQSHFQTSQKKQSLIDQSQSFEVNKLNIYSNSENLQHTEQKNYKNGEYIHEQNNRNNLNKQKMNNNMVQSSYNINQTNKGQQDSPLTSQRRSLPPKSSGRSSKKGIKMDSLLQIEQSKSTNDIIKQQKAIQNQIQKNTKQNIADKQIDVQIDRNLINIQNNQIQNTFQQNNQIQEQTNKMTNIQINDSQILINQLIDNSQRSICQSVDNFENQLNQNFENIQNSMNQTIEENSNSSGELQEQANKSQQILMNSQQIQINQQHMQHINQEENNQQINLSVQERLKTSNKQTQNELLQTSSCLGESFQVFKANGSDSNSEFQQENSNLDSLQITENDLLIKQKQSTSNRNKLISKQIEIKIQNFIYNDEWINYQGQYFNNTFSGVGYLQLKNNCSYHGEFLMGKLNGYGSFFIGSQNQMILGYFQNNILIKKCN